MSDEIAAYVDKLEAMLGDLGSPQMLLMVAEQHEVCADWCAKSGRRPGRAEAFRAAAAMIRERAGAAPPVSPPDQEPGA